MSQVFSGRLTIELVLSMLDDGDLSNFTTPLSSGTEKFPELGSQLQDGTGAGKISKFFAEKRTLEHLDHIDYNLQSLPDRPGIEFLFTQIKWVILRVRGPVSGMYLSVGAADVDTWEWIFGAGAGGTENDVGEEGGTAGTRELMRIPNRLVITNEVDGWVVGDFNRVFRLMNVCGQDLTYDLVLAGEGATVEE